MFQCSSIAMKEQKNFYQKKTISKKQLEISEHKAGNLQKSRLFKKYVKHFVKAYRTAALQNAKLQQHLQRVEQ